MSENLFTTGKCGLPAITPIPALPFIDDCGIPIAPVTITDCNDVDLPFPGADGGDGPPGADGIPGANGLHGADGQDGFTATPIVIAESFRIIVYDPASISLSVSIMEIAENTFLLTFFFYLYVPAWQRDTCCYWVRCGGSWHRIGINEDCEQPCAVGDTCDGELKIYCEECD